MTMWFFCEGWDPLVDREPCQIFQMYTASAESDISDMNERSCVDHPRAEVHADHSEVDYDDRVAETMSRDFTQDTYCGSWINKENFFTHLTMDGDCARSVLAYWEQTSDDHYGISDHDAWNLMQRLDMTPPDWLLDIAEEEDWIQEPDEPYLDPPMEAIFDPAGQPTPAAIVTGPSYVQLWG
jgi:hypothetical protein